MTVQNASVFPLSSLPLFPSTWKHKLAKKHQIDGHTRPKIIKAKVVCIIIQL